MEFNCIFFIFIISNFSFTFLSNIHFINENDKSCLNIFKSNNFLGLIIFLNILIGKLID